MFDGEGTVDWDDKYLPFDIVGGSLNNNGTARGEVFFTMVYRDGDNHHKLTGHLSNRSTTLSGSWHYVDGHGKHILPGEPGGTFKLHYESRKQGLRFLLFFICSG
jgi:hypothetical protein